jgi:hypothetical protein
MSRWMIHCRDATRLVLQAEDRPLRWPDRLRLRAHLAVCAACPRFVRQVALMRSTMGSWRAYRDSEGPPDASGN